MRFLQADPPFKKGFRHGLGVDVLHGHLEPIEGPRLRTTPEANAKRQIRPDCLSVVGNGKVFGPEQKEMAGPFETTPSVADTSSRETR